MKIVKVPSRERVGIVNVSSPPEVELEIDVRPRKGELVIWVTNPNTFKVETSNEIELYEYVGFWQRIDPGIVFLDRRIVLIPGETMEQKLPLELPPGRYKVVKFAYVNGAKVRIEKEFTV
ncbi:hypothetical protein [Thermococcus sp.]